MGDDWEDKCLGDILVLQRGHDLPSQSRVDGSIPIMGSAGLTGYHNEAKSKGPGVVVGRSGNSMGEVHYTANDYWPLNTVLYVKDFKGNDAKFIYYFLKTINFDQFNSGSAQKSLNRNAVYPHRIIFPRNLEDQKRIASILGMQDDKIELNCQINKTLEEMAQAIFKSWFVDFEPVKAKIGAKAGGRDPERAAMCAISGKTDDELDQLPPKQLAQLQATAALFPGELMDSELGLIPRGWSIVPFSQIAQLDTTSVKPQNDKEKEWEHYSIPAFDKSEYPVFEMGSEIKSNKYKVHPSAILVSKLNPRFPRIWWPTVENKDAAVCSTEFMQFIPIYSDHRAFVYAMVLSFSFQQGILQCVTGTTGSRQRAQPKSVAEMSVIYPGKNLIESFVSICGRMFFQKGMNIRENKTLIQLRDTLLPKLLSGEIDLSGNISSE